MKRQKLLKMIEMVVFFCFLQAAWAETRYVSLSGGHIPPFTNWAGAARDIQTAIDASENNDTVWVTNGIYATGGRTAPGASLTNRIVVTNAIIVRSVNGWANTMIVGQGPLGDSAIRCAYLANDASLIGFTLSNGCTRMSGKWEEDQWGGGVFVSGTSYYTRVEHCVLSGNTATKGGGAYGGDLYDCYIGQNTAYRGGGVSRVRAVQCQIVSNHATYGGGSSDSAISGCIIEHNTAGSDGGGCCDDDVGEQSAIRRNRAYGQGGGLYRGCVETCRIEENHAMSGGGMSSSLISNCEFRGNHADRSGGGAYGGTMYSSLLSGNSADHVGGGQADSTLYNCTVVGNKATNQAGGCYAGTLYNCIVWSNRATSDSNFWGGTYTYCCTTPNPGGIGNLSDDPRFVNAAGENYRLQSNSPCVNAGTNQDWMMGAWDLNTDENPRIRGGRVDMGAYERMISLMPDNWLMRYDLALDGSDDFRDKDEDGMDNWREWRCETDPNNRWSLLKCVADNSMVTPTGIVVCWQSVAGKMYTVERSTNLSVSSPFIEIATDILAEAENTTHTDTTAVGSGPWFYRVGVK